MPLVLRLREILRRAGLRLVTFEYLEKWVVLGSIIGVVGGLAALAFYYLLELCGWIFRQLWSLPFGVQISLIIGGALSGFLVFHYAPEAEGHGTDAFIEAFHAKWGKIRSIVPFIKTIASAITIGSGGSAGREGPIALIASGVASALASRLHLSAKDRQILITCGAASGIGSIFKAPLGASIFGVEVLYKRDLEVEGLMPALISSIVGYSLFSSVVGWGPVFKCPQYLFKSPVELFFFALLGLVCGLVAVLYVKIFYGLKSAFFDKIPTIPHLKPVVGAALLGVLAFFTPQVLGMGYEYVQEALYGNLPLTLMLILAFSKIFATSFTISSGGSGGVFAPSLFIGAMLGGALGKLFGLIAPAVVIHPAAYALIGMASFFAAAGKVPVASIIMVCEMTGNYNLLVPIMLASAISYIVSGDATIYASQLPRRG